MVLSVPGVILRVWTGGHEDSVDPHTGTVLNITAFASMARNSENRTELLFSFLGTGVLE